MVKRLLRIVLLLALLTAAHGAPYGSWLSGATAHAATVQPPQTGQTTCYNNTGTEVPCAGTGQDGDIKAGTSWPKPRFTDIGNGTVTDNLTGLIWLKDANCRTNLGGVNKTGSLNWANTLVWSNALHTGFCNLNDGSSVGQWRLPSRRELHSLIDFSQSGLPAGHPFSNLVVTDTYWTSSTYADSTTSAWILYMNSGALNILGKTNVSYVLPVRGGQ